jgi:hypothetical protein
LALDEPKGSGHVAARKFRDADLFNEAPYQAQYVPLAFGLGLETPPSSPMVMVTVSTSPKLLCTDTMIDPLLPGRAWS